MYFFRDSVINEESHQSVIKIFMRLILATVLVLSTCTVECFILGSGPTCIRSHVRDQCLSTSKFYQQQDSKSIDGFNISRRDAALLTISGVGEYYFKIPFSNMNKLQNLTLELTRGSHCFVINLSLPLSDTASLEVFNMCINIH